MQLEPSDEQVLVSSSGDKTASVWDRRKLAPGVKPLATASANNTILSAYFSPAGMAFFYPPPVMVQHGDVIRQKSGWSRAFPLPLHYRP